MKPVVLITGVAGGIGYATAQLFAREGWEVVGVDRQTDKHLPEIHTYYQADCAEAEQINLVMQKITTTLGTIDVLVNNAAMQICKPIIDMTIKEWDQIMAVNVRSAFLFAQGAYPLLEATQGSVINISSVHAVATSANIAAYATSKGALVAFTRALAIEWAEAKIRVNAILPGAVDTPMLHAGLTRGHLAGGNLKELMEQLGEKTVMGRVGKPEEIAQAILFLADKNKSSFMTGQTLIIDGGATARLSTE